MDYTEKVMDHFQNPRNVGEINDADGVGEVGNLKCGDVMKISIKVGKRPKELQVTSNELRGATSNSELETSNCELEEFIEDIKFKTLGCAAAIASSSMTTEIARGKSLEEAENISKDDINEALGKLPAPKYHCSILAAEGIKKAIEDYKSKKVK